MVHEANGRGRCVSIIAHRAGDCFFSSSEKKAAGGGPRAKGRRVVDRLGEYNDETESAKALSSEEFTRFLVQLVVGSVAWMSLFMVRWA